MMVHRQSSPALISVLSNQTLPTFLQVNFDMMDEILIRIAPVAEEDAQRGAGFLQCELMSTLFTNVHFALLAEDYVHRRTLGALDFSRHDSLLPEVR